MAGAGERLGRYLLKEKLGQGGMGVVFLAVQEGLGREVALKVLNEERMARGAEARRRFLREAAVCARLSHPNVIKVFDYGVEEDCCYYAMEVLRATSLEDQLQAEPVPPLERTLRLAREMASAFEHFHPLGVVHRDIKPSNIMIDPDGRAILMDFGLVKDLMATGITREGSAVGTPYYMAPEQVLSRPVTGATDIYQLGVVLYRMATGAYPFDGKTTSEVFRQLLTAVPRAPRELNPRLPVPVENVILNCIAKEPSARYPDAARLSADLAAASRRQPVRRLGEESDSAPLAPPRGPSRQAVASPTAEPAHQDSPSPAAGRRVAAVLGAGLALLALTAGFLAWKGRPPPELELRERLGFQRAMIQWRQAAGLPAALEWGEEGGAVRPAEVDSSAPSTRRAALGPLEPGRKYRYRLVHADGSRSLDHRFGTAAKTLSRVEVLAAPGGFELAVETSLPARMEGPRAVRPGKKVSAAAARAGLLGSSGKSGNASEAPTLHRLYFPAAALDGDSELPPFGVTLVDAAGDVQRLGLAELRAAALAELLPRLAPELARELATFPFDSFLLRKIDQELPASVCTGAMITLQRHGFDGVVQGIGGSEVPRYAHFEAGDALAAKLAARIAEELDNRPFRATLAKLVFAGRGLFDQRRFSPDTTLRLLEALQKVRDLDYYTGFLRIPYAIGIEDIFSRDFRVGYEPRLVTMPPLDHPIPGSGLWGHPWTEYVLAHSTGMGIGTLVMTPPHEWRPVLPDPAGISRVELTLTGVRLEGELFFRVIVNGALRLVFRPDAVRHAPGRPKDYPTLTMSFDSRFLKAGENLFRVEIDSLPGTRYMSLKRGNRLKGLRLGWQ
ncbi:MAG: serine/threonine protein kinase [Candidatus Wallbacteria bacterium]|nr:serine/threonine protein kinase [Candidatus Wallbacteria bacterium]